MKSKTAKELMLDELQKRKVNPEYLTCQYMPAAIPNVMVWMKTVTFAELPDDLEQFFCYDQDWTYSYRRIPEEKITVEPARVAKKNL